jgi:hypothetical protein
MRLICLVIVLFCIIPANARGQEAAKEKELADLLKKHGIQLDADFLGKGATTAVINVVDADTVKALEMLKQVKNLLNVKIHVEDTKLVNESLKRIADLPQLKRLTLSARVLNADDLKQLLRLKLLEDLTLKCEEMADAHLKQLHAMKGVKLVHLCSAQLPSKSFEELKRALPKTDIQFQVVPKLAFAWPLKISNDDGTLARLQKEKYNVALATVQIQWEKFEQGTGQIASRDFADSLRRLSDAASDLNDPGFTLKTLEGQVEVMEIVFLISEGRYKNGQMRPEELQEKRYDYLDAQILLAKHKKKLELK